MNLKTAMGRNSRITGHRPRSGIERRESEQCFRNLISRNNAIILQIDPASGKIMYANASACSFYGWSAAEMCARTIQEINTLDPQQVTAEYKAAAANKRNYFIFPHRLANGETRMVEVHSTPITTQKHTVLVSIIHDITQRVHDEALFDSLMREQKAILNSRIVGIVKLNDRRFVWSNEAFAGMLGYTSEELAGQPTRILYPGEQAYYAVGETAYPVIASGEIFRSEVQFQRKNGSLCWFEISGGSIHPGSDESIWAFVDITVRRQAEEKLQHASRLLEQQSLAIARSNTDLQRFAVINAHHLQEPARRLASYADRLIKQLDWRTMDAEARLSLEFIGQQAHRQLNLLRDIDGYLVADQARGKIEQTDAGMVVLRLLEWKAERIAETGASVTVGDLPPARIDALRLAELFELALDNAMQHGGASSRTDDLPGMKSNALRITIEGERIGSTVRYRVSDNGPGIEEEYRERVFRVFERLAAGSDIASTSTGIGLAIIRRIAESRGGSAWIEETPGGGCSVVFDLSAEEGA